MNPTTKIIIYIIIALLIIYIGYQLLSGPAEEPETIKIGAILPLTGNFSWLGEGERNALLLAKKKFDQKSNTSIELILEDSEGDVKKGVSAVHKLINLDRVSALITTLSNISQAVQPIAQENKIPQFAISIHPEITHESEYTFRIYPSIQLEAEKMAEYIKTKQFKNIAVLYINTPESQILANKYLEKFGAHIASSEGFNFSDQDIKTQLIKIKDKNPHALIISAFSHQHPMIFKGLAELGMTQIPIIGDINFSFTSGDISVIEGSVFVGPSFMLEQKESEEFRQQYKNAYGNEPNYDPAFLYDNFAILAKALASSSSAEEILNNLHATQNYKGASGNISILENGDSIVAMDLFMVQDGQFVKYEE